MPSPKTTLGTQTLSTSGGGDRQRLFLWLSLQAVKEMREADRLKGFLANMSHEMDALNSIIGLRPF
jgi:hypothetical protein